MQAFGVSRHIGYRRAGDDSRFHREGSCDVAHFAAFSREFVDCAAAI